MAVILSAQTGDFSSPTTWVGGVVPTIGDEAQCRAGHNISITANTSCNLLSKVGVSGGGYLFYNNITITANIQSKATGGYAAIFAGPNPQTVTIIGNVTGSTTGASFAVGVGGTLNLTGNVTGGSSNGSDGVVLQSSGAVANITGNVLGGTVSGANGVNVITAAAGSTLSITGNITGRGGHGVNCQPTGSMNLSVNNSTIQGGTGASIMGISYSSPSALVLTNTNLIGGSSTSTHGINNIGAATITVNGNCTGGTSSGHGLQNASTGTINISGYCQGGSSSAHGLNNAAGGTVNVTGNCIGGTTTTSLGLNNAGVGIVSILGSAIGGNGGAGVVNASTGAISIRKVVGNNYGLGSIGITAAVGAVNSGLGIINIEEIEYGTLGMSPTSGTAFRLKKLSTNTAKFNYCDTAGSKTLVDGTQGQMPSITDVRFGTTYASGSLTGTAYIPSPSSVAYGVPVDATTGTAVLTQTAIWNSLTSGMTTSGSIGERLANASTVAVTGQQITSALG
jgi:hypothetical protein